VPFVKLTTVLLAVLLTACGSLDLSAISTAMGYPTRNTYPTPGGTVTLPPSSNPNVNAPDLQSYRVQAAKKIMQANTSNTFGGALPDPLASIPVIEITLNSDGSIRALDVRRTPKFYPETVELAKAAIRRAAPFGAVAHLPQPWQFNETFLFNDSLKFQLHVLQPQ
jgi:hypothetical protein